MEWGISPGLDRGGVLCRDLDFYAISGGLYVDQLIFEKVKLVVRFPFNLFNLGLYRNYRNINMGGKKHGGVGAFICRLGKYML